MFGGRMRRQLKLGEITDPQVKKCELMLTEILSARFPDVKLMPMEVLIAAMWIVYLAFSTAKPNAKRKELQALNDAYARIFNELGMDKYDGEPDLSDPQYLSFSHQYTNNCIAVLQQRVMGYDAAFNRDKGSAFMTPDEAFLDFIPVNLLNVLAFNVFNEELTEFDASQLEEDFVHGFMDFFTSSLNEAVQQLSF